ncbi:MAG: hypothetical protein UU48_C0047G0001, partial [Candidatus Uhrbacteria bacterium GW2011_GWF2_41_16]
MFAIHSGKIKQAIKATALFVLLSCGFASFSNAGIKSIIISAGNSSESSEITHGLKLEIPNAPAWLTIMPTSLLGPQALYPGETYSFRLDFDVNADSGTQLELELWITQENTNILPNKTIWVYRSTDGFVTAAGECTDSEENYCGGYITRDKTAPVSEVGILGKSCEKDSIVYISTITSLRITSSDPELLNARSAGVFATLVGIDKAAVTCKELTDFYIEPLPFHSGEHNIQFCTFDDAGNFEVIKSTTIYVDGSAPVSDIQVYGSSTTDAQGNLVVSTDHYISFISSDPESNGVASGLKHVLFNLDGGAFTVFQSSFTLAEGFHKIVYYGVDNVDNAESTHIFQAFFGQAPENVSWTGLAGDGNWSNPANWLNGKLPTANDTVLLATRDTIDISSPTIFHSLALGDTQGLSAPILLISTGITFTGNLTLNRNAVLAQNTTEPIHAASLYMLAGSKIEHTANTDIRRSVVNLEVAGDFVMEAGSSITVDGLGYAGGSHGASGYGPGKGIGNYWSGAGAGHGGQSNCFGYAGCSA